MKEELLPCPFCGKIPELFPKYPKLEGDAWAEVKCFNNKCFVKPSAQYFGEVKPFQRAIRRWNKRNNQPPE
jgi:hypothetical protein